MYSAIIIHRIRTQQSIIIIHLLQQLVRGAEQLQVHAGGCYTHNHLQFSLNVEQKQQIV